MSRANEQAYPGATHVEAANADECRAMGCGATVAVMSSGLTIREHFAALALQGLVANSENNRFAHPDTGENAKDSKQDAEFAATYAVMMADALIAELAKVQK